VNGTTKHAKHAKGKLRSDIQVPARR